MLEIPLFFRCSFKTSFEDDGMCLMQESVQCLEQA